MKKTIAYLLLITLFATLTACSGYAIGATAEAGTTASTQQTPEVTVVPISVEYDDDDLTTGASSAGASSAATTTIELDGDTTTFNRNGVAVDGNIVTITSAGTYNISGTLNDGQIVVDTADEETVVLVLNGVDVTCATSAPIYVSNADHPR